MADTVDVDVQNYPKALVVHMTAISDGTGESAVVKVDKSAYTVQESPGDTSAEPAALDVAAIRWNIQGYASIRLYWDHGTDDLMRVLSGSGYDDGKGPGVVGVSGQVAFADPQTASGTGDILLTTNGHASGSTYDITLWLVKRP